MIYNDNVAIRRIYWSSPTSITKFWSTLIVLCLNIFCSRHQPGVLFKFIIILFIVLFFYYLNESLRQEDKLLLVFLEIFYF